MKERQIRPNDLVRVASVGVVCFSLLVAASHNKESGCIDQFTIKGNDKDIMVCTDEHERVLVRSRDRVVELPKGLKETDVVVGSEERVAWGFVDQDHWLDVYLLKMNTGEITHPFHEKIMVEGDPNEVGNS